MNLTVVKFGGSSLADAKHFLNAARIIKEDSSRRYVVVSAPGKRSAQDIKITDMLLHSLNSTDRDSIINAVAERFQEIIHDLGLSLSIEDDITQMKRASRAGLRDFLISRGEYVSARIMAALLNYDFIDAQKGVRFHAPFLCDWNSTRTCMERLLKKSSHAVIPGFYGSDSHGNVCTFLRGGSDITGSIVADAVGADLYENWTDVSGVLAGDPHIVPNPSPIQTLTYDELRTFSHLGAEVLHEDAIRPCQRTRIPIIIKNASRPWDKGTFITTCHQKAVTVPPLAVGAKKGMSMLSVNYRGTAADAQAQIRQVFCRIGIQIEHISVTECTVTIIAASSDIKPCEQHLVESLSQLGSTSRVAVKHGLVLLGVIGKFPNHAKKLMGNISHALNRADIAIDLIGKGYDNCCVIAIVKKTDRVKAVNTIYKEIIQ